MPRLHDYLAENTERTYESRERVVFVGATTVKDVVQRFAAFVRQGPPIGTALPTRATALRRIREIDAKITPVQASEMLASLEGLKAQSQRFALDDAQLQLYYKAVEAMDPGNVRTALLLLPQTGLRPSEICALPMKNVRKVAGGYDLEVSGKSRDIRTVRVRKRGAEVLQVHLETVKGAAYLFPGKGGRWTRATMDPQMLQHAVAGYRTRKVPVEGIAQKIGVEGLTPYVLRHTFATQLLQKGMDIPTISRMMGHESTRTTEEYLHIADAQAERAALLVAQE